MTAPVSDVTVKIQECWENILPLAAYEGWISLIFALRGGLFEVLRSNMDENITNHYRCEMPIECGAFVRWLVGSRRGFLIGCGRGSCEGMGSGGGIAARGGACRRAAPSFRVVSEISTLNQD